MTTTDIAVHATDAPSMGAFDATDETVARYLGLDPRKPADRAAVAVCRHYGFDPILKHVVVIPQGGVYITRDGLLNVAHRSGQLDGIVVDKHPVLEGDEWVAIVSVYRKDMRHPFTYPGRYPANGGNRKHAPEMALKCAEAHALRRAFDIGGLPTEDERRPEESQPTPRATADDFLNPPNDEPGVLMNEGQPATSINPEPPGEDVQDADVVDEPVDPRLTRRMFAAFTAAGFTEDARSEAGRTRRLTYISQIVGRDIASSKELTGPEVAEVVDALEQDAQEQQ
jgi:hypothetical protein